MKWCERAGGTWMTGLSFIIAFRISGRVCKRHLQPRRETHQMHLPLPELGSVLTALLPSLLAGAAAVANVSFSPVAGMWILFDCNSSFIVSRGRVQTLQTTLVNSTPFKLFLWCPPIPPLPASEGRWPPLMPRKQRQQIVQSFCKQINSRVVFHIIGGTI